jgi:N,N'-diacetyllegionaminate synthase
LTMESFSIGDHMIGTDAPVFIIAEIGINHGGREEECARLIEFAAESGANAAKLQIIDADESYVRGTKSHKAFSGCSLSVEAIDRLCVKAEDCGILLFATPGDFKSLKTVIDARMPAIKISSGLLTNLPLIRQAAETGLPQIMSTGMAEMADITIALNASRHAGANKIALLQCTSIYPTPPSDVNLRAMNTLALEFFVPTGYSDHTLGPLACIAAVAAGATIIEKHFTLNSHQPGADHAISSIPEEFADMVRQIRLVEKMKGSDAKLPAAEEEKIKNHTLRCLVARCAINIGEVFTSENVGLKRPLPGTVGLPPTRYDDIIGRRSTRPLALDDPINTMDIET